MLNKFLELSTLRVVKFGGNSAFIENNLIIARMGIGVL
jgi:hypothetical protein